MRIGRYELECPPIPGGISILVAGTVADCGHPVTGERQLRVGQSPDLIAELVVLMDTGGTLFEAAETGACLALSNLLGRCLHTSALNLRLFLEADGIGVIQRRWRAIQEHEQASLSWLFMEQMVGGEGSAEVR